MSLIFDWFLSFSLRVGASSGVAFFHLCRVSSMFCMMGCSFSWDCTNQSGDWCLGLIAVALAAMLRVSNQAV